MRRVPSPFLSATWLIEAMCSLTPKARILCSVINTYRWISHYRARDSMASVKEITPSVWKKGRGGCGLLVRILGSEILVGDVGDWQECILSCWFKLEKLKSTLDCSSVTRMLKPHSFAFLMTPNQTVRPSATSLSEDSSMFISSSTAQPGKSYMTIRSCLESQICLLSGHLAGRKHLFKEITKTQCRTQLSPTSTWNSHLRLSTLTLECTIDLRISHLTARYGPIQRVYKHWLKLRASVSLHTWILQYTPRNR